MNFVDKKAILKDQTAKLVAEYIANGGQVERVAPAKDPKIDRYSSKNIPGSIAHRGAQRAALVGY